MTGIALLTTGCGSPDDEPIALVDVNLPLDAECRAALVDDGLPVGIYDINPGSGHCERDYETHLRILSYQRHDPDNYETSWGKVEPTLLQVHSAVVTLRDGDGAAIVFPGTNSPTPNPFEPNTSTTLFESRSGEPSVASAALQTIPAAYRQFLADFVGETIVADIQLSATALDFRAREDFDLEVFSYPIEICDGCLTRCASEAAEDPPPTDACNDDGGQDGHLCHDTDC